MVSLFRRVHYRRFHCTSNYKWKKTFVVVRTTQRDKKGEGVANHLIKFCVCVFYPVPSY